MGITIPLDKLGQALGHDLGQVLAKKDTIVKNVRALVKTRGISMAHEEVRRAKPPPFNTGFYNMAFKAADIEDGVKLYNAAPYAPVIEGGRRPGATQPPTAALIPWVQRKLGKSLKEARGIAFVIAKAIARRGLPAKNILRNTGARLLPEVARVIDAALKEPI